MPTAKRVKRSGAASSKRGAAAATAPAPVDNATADERPTPAELEEEEHPFVQVARNNWLKAGKKGATVKVKNDVLKQSIWDALEKDGFSHKSLVLLESLQTLEK